MYSKLLLLLVLEQGNMNVEILFFLPQFCYVIATTFFFTVFLTLFISVWKVKILTAVYLLFSNFLLINK